MKNTVNNALRAGAMVLTATAGLTMVSAKADAHYLIKHGHIYAPIRVLTYRPFVHYPARHHYYFTGAYAYTGASALCYPKPNSPAYRGCIYLGHTPTVAPTGLLTPTTIVAPTAIATPAPVVAAAIVAPTPHLAPVLPYSTVGFEPYGYGYPYATSYGVYGYGY